MICGFLLFILIKTYMNMTMWFVKVKNWKFKALNGHFLIWQQFKHFWVFVVKCSSCSSEEHWLEYKF
jgi:hypothetical protein